MHMCTPHLGTNSHTCAHRTRVQTHTRVHTTVRYKHVHTTHRHKFTHVCTPHSGTNSRTCAHRTAVQTHAPLLSRPNSHLLRQIFYVVFQAQPHTPGSMSMWQLIHSTLCHTWLFHLPILSENLAPTGVQIHFFHFTFHLEFHRQSFAIQTNSLSTHIYNIQNIYYIYYTLSIYVHIYI